MTLSDAPSRPLSVPIRIEALDWLRGLMALAIMLFHLGAFEYIGGPFDASTVLGKLGIYGVSTFFVLSGLSMAVGYNSFLKGAGTAMRFFIRRIFRISPLLWLAVGYAVVIGRFEGNNFSLALIVANLTTLFGFVWPTAYLNKGAWSIGNEMVYYALTPAFIWTYRRSVPLGNLLTAITAAIGAVFAFWLPNPASQWATYVNPLNNMYFYFAGVALFYNCRRMAERARVGTIGLLAVVAAFVLYPSAGDQVSLVTGAPRVAFSILVIASVYFAYTMPLPLSVLLSRPLEKLGTATYGVYLLHPIVISALTILFARIGLVSTWLFPLLVVTITIGVALISFRFFEQPLMRIGKRLTSPRRAVRAIAEMAGQTQQDQL